MLIADPWLLDLAVDHINSRVVASMLFRCQVRTFRRTGHIIDFGDVLTQESIFKAARRAKLAHAYVRCSRCGLQRLIRDWVRADTIDSVEPFALQLPELGGADLVLIGHRLPCVGDDLARGLAAIFERSMPSEGAVR